MCSARAGFILVKTRQRSCCRRWPKTQRSVAEHRGAHRKKDQRYRATSLEKQVIRHHPSGDPPHTSDSQLLTSWTNPEQEARPCHARSWAVGMPLVDQSPEHSGTEWLCVDVAGYKINNVYKAPRSRLTPTTIPTFPHPSLYAGYTMSTGFTTKYLLTVRAWTSGQHPTTLGCCTTQREELVSSLTGRMLV